MIPGEEHSLIKVTGGGSDTKTFYYNNNNIIIIIKIIENKGKKEQCSC